MSSKSYEILEEIFTNQINVLSIAIPIQKLKLSEAKINCLEKGYDFHLVSNDDSDEIKVYDNNKNIVRSIKNNELISDSTPILDVLESLCNSDCVFVLSGKTLTHIVTQSDLDTIPIRIWLYGMISLFEIELKDKIEIDSIQWQASLTQGRLEKANELFNDKKKRNEEISLLGCIQISDLGTILIKNHEKFSKYLPKNFSKKSLKDLFKESTELRDTLAHGQKIKFEWQKVWDIMKTITFILKSI